ncbi:MAG: hypothetical protein AB1632_11960 [Nitrospirota bacterium]
MIIKGIICSSLKSASSNIKLQKKYFKGLPFIRRLYDGTINLNISPRKFIVKKADFVFRSIHWGPLTEDFDFIPIRQINSGRGRVSITGYLYLPSLSPNRYGGTVLEIWTEWIDNITAGEIMEIKIPDNRLEIK